MQRVYQFHHFGVSQKYNASGCNPPRRAYTLAAISIRRREEEIRSV